MTPEVERDEAHHWRWHTVGKAASQSRHSITMTAGDDELRFFEAGYLGQQGTLFVRNAAPLMSSLSLRLPLEGVCLGIVG
jgi:hypothetical protein